MDINILTFLSSYALLSIIVSLEERSLGLDGSGQLLEVNSEVLLYTLTI